MPKRTEEKVKIPLEISNQFGKPGAPCSTDAIIKLAIMRANVLGLEGRKIVDIQGGKWGLLIGTSKGRNKPGIFLIYEEVGDVQETKEDSKDNS